MLLFFSICITFSLYFLFFFSAFCLNYVFLTILFSPSITIVITYFFTILIVSRLLESYFISSSTYATIVMLSSFCFQNVFFFFFCSKLMIIIVWIVSIDLYLLTYLPFSCFSFLQTALLVPIINSLPLSSKSTHHCLFCGHGGGLCKCGFAGWRDAKLCQQRAQSRQWGTDSVLFLVPRCPYHQHLPRADLLVLGSCSKRSFSPTHLPQHPIEWRHSRVLLVNTSLLMTAPLSDGLAVTPPSEQLPPTFLTVDF